MAEFTWSAEELPLLEAIRTAEANSSVGPVDATRLVHELDLAGDTITRVLRNLHQAGYVAGRSRHVRAGSPEELYEVELTEKGRQAVGQWPTADSMVEGFIEALRAVAAESDDSGESASLNKVADTFQDVLKSTAGGLLLGLLKARFGIS